MESTRNRSRPLIAAVVVVTATTCAVLAWHVRPAQAVACASEPNPALLGCENTSVHTTIFTATGSGASAVRGNATGGNAAAGLSGSGIFGVYGTGEYGVYGTGVQFGVWGEADSTSQGIGVRGHGQVGVDGASGSGFGVVGATDTGTALAGFGGGSGTALAVNGKATFSRSGIVTIPAGTSSKTVTLAGVTTASMVLATAQQSKTVSVKAAVPAAGSFKIVLTGNAPTGGLKVAYFVLN